MPYDPILTTVFARLSKGCISEKYKINVILFSGTQKRLMLLEQCHSKLSKSGNPGLKNLIEQAINIFQSDFFHSLLG